MKIFNQRLLSLKANYHNYYAWSIKSHFSSLLDRIGISEKFKSVQYFGFDVFARSCKNHLTRKQQMRLRLGL